MQQSPTLKHGDGESPVRGKKTCLAVAIAGVLGLMSGTVSAASTFIHSEHYVSGPDSMVAGVLHEEHFVTQYAVKPRLFRAGI